MREYAQSHERGIFRKEVPGYEAARAFSFLQMLKSVSQKGWDVAKFIDTIPPSFREAGVQGERFSLTMLRALAALYREKPNPSSREAAECMASYDEDGRLDLPEYFAYEVLECDSTWNRVKGFIDEAVEIWSPAWATEDIDSLLYMLRDIPKKEHHRLKNVWRSKRANANDGNGYTERFHKKLVEAWNESQKKTVPTQAPVAAPPPAPAPAPAPTPAPSRSTPRPRHRTTVGRASSATRPTTNRGIGPTSSATVAANLGTWPSIAHCANTWQLPFHRDT